MRAFDVYANILKYTEDHSTVNVIHVLNRFALGWKKTTTPVMCVVDFVMTPPLSDPLYLLYWYQCPPFLHRYMYKYHRSKEFTDERI